ncbi:MAG TPA: protein kinase, partial [Polyangiaceae bacterium]|nr:protein kinase [Polyangiaceae bacterium]
DAGDLAVAAESGVVAVLDDDETDDGAPFLIMELLLGQTLSKRWKKLGRRMPIVEAFRIALPVLDCLSACHAASVIHRDLKPPNIFLTDDGRVKILDFGVAQLRDATTEKTRTGTALGTPYYMSPEQAMGLVDQLDGRADLFSVGAILHALITGQRIHNARTENEALILAATTPVPTVARIDPNLPIEVIKLIDKSLAWDRRNRHADATAMREDVERTLALVQGQPSTAPVRMPSAREVAAIPEAPAARGVARPSSPSRPAQPPQTVPTRSVPSHRPSIPPSVVEEETAEEDDPRVQEARDLFKHIDRLLPTGRQLGLEHPATERAMRTSYEAFVLALNRQPQALRWKVRPYSFLVLNQTVWEPGAPFDTIPYNMFAAGVRQFVMLPGLAFEEFRTVVALMMLDPGQDLPPEDDLVSAFWDRGLSHVAFETTDPFTDGDAGQREAFVDEADELEDLAARASEARLNLIEAKAMAVSTDRGALGQSSGQSPMALEHTIQLAFAPHLEVTREQWTERYVDVLVDGLRDALQTGDASLVLGSLRKSASDLVVAGRLRVAVELYRTIANKLQSSTDASLRGVVSELTDSMFGGDTLRILLDQVIADPDLADALDVVLAQLSANVLPVILAALQRSFPPAVRTALLKFIERSIQGYEETLVEAIPGLDPVVLFPLLDLLNRLKTPAAREALVSLTKNKDIAVRIEAKVLCATSPEAAEEELVSLLQDKAIGVRIAALRAIARHDMKKTVAAVTRRIHGSDFGNLTLEERRELFITVLRLAPDRGEALALETAKKGGLFSSESRELTRCAAIDALGAVSASLQVARELAQVAQSRWATTDETRSRASAAMAQIEARAAERREGAS